MTKIGASEAKARFAALLERVARGEEVAITKRGVIMACLVPPRAEPRLTRERAIEELLRFRHGRKASRREQQRWKQAGRG